MKPTDIALSALQKFEKKGSTFKQIMKYINKDYNCETDHLDKVIRVALQRAVRHGKIYYKNGRYTLEPDKKEECGKNISIIDLPKRSIKGRCRVRRGKSRRKSSSRGHRRRSRSKARRLVSRCGGTRRRRSSRRHSRNRRGHRSGRRRTQRSSRGTKSRRRRSKGSSRRRLRRSRSGARKRRSCRCSGRRPRRCNSDEENI